MAYNCQKDQPFAVEITGILESDERIIRVTLKATGKPAAIRRDQVIDVKPGIIFIPYWLADRILKTSNEKMALL